MKTGLKFLLLVLLFSACKKADQTNVGNFPQGWSRLGGSFGLNYTNTAVHAITTDQNDNIYVCQDYDPANQWTPLKYNGTSWSKLGTLNSSDLTEHVIIKTDQANNVYIYVAQAAAISNSTNLPYIAKYDGSWRMVGPDNNSSVSTVTSAIPFSVVPSGIIYASFLRPLTGIDYTNVRWNGSAWDAIPKQYSDPVSGQVVTADMEYGLTTDKDGNVYAPSHFGINNVISKYNGSAWQNLGLPSPTNTSISGFNMICDKDDNLYVIVYNTTTAIYSVVKWNGTTWSSLGNLNGNSYISALAVDLNGNVYAGGNFTNASGKHFVAKWDGSNWEELGGANSLGANDEILALAIDSRGYVYAGGKFTNSSGEAYVAVYKP